MDRNISDDVKRSRRRKIILWSASATFAIAAGVFALSRMSATSVNRSELTFSTANRGLVESSVEANGMVVAAVEQIIVSPVNSKILEVYCQEGEVLQAGSPILRLDIEETRAASQRLRDERDMKRNDINQTEINSETSISELQMKIRTKQMQVDQLRAEADSERRLDSIGSGTGERVRQAELAWRTGQLELDQMRHQLLNEQRVSRAQLASKRLEGNIAERNLTQSIRTLDDANILAPTEATVTFLNHNIGASVSAGEKIAVLSDLSHFKINGEMRDGYGSKLAIGAPVKVRIGSTDHTGHITNISAQSKSGVVPFTVALDNDNAAGLRPGLSAMISVIFDIRKDAVRIANGPFFDGSGAYELFVVDSEGNLEKRHVVLGDSNPDFIEVKSGLQPGDEVVISDLKHFERKKFLKLK